MKPDPEGPFPSPDPDSEVPEDDLGEHPQYEAPSSIIAKHKLEDTEKWRPCLAYLPLRMV